MAPKWRLGAGVAIYNIKIHIEQNIKSRKLPQILTKRYNTQKRVKTHDIIFYYYFPEYLCI